MGCGAAIARPRGGGARGVEWDGFAKVSTMLYRLLYRAINLTALVQRFSQHASHVSRSSSSSKIGSRLFPREIT